MILKSLQLQGFKSFPDKTTLTFDHGTTMVVGPNGSGKSNISDAMKWVLGEISSKNLRGSRMEDVIFGGTDSRKQMGFAEVSVTFDNTATENGTRLATDFDEVTVTRRYYRAGESEYFINAKPVRLRDIHELFMNTGIGREGYSIIGQGKIAEILSRKSDERRAIFEEAAGIAKYKYKKEEAQKKLLAVEDNLLRVSDIVSELEARVGPLEKESAKARTYLELYEQKKQADISLWLYDMQTLKATISSLEEAFLLSKQEYEMACALKEDLENQRQHLHTLTQEYKAKEDDAREIAAVNTEEKLRLEAECKVAENDISHIDARLNENINIADLQLSQVSGEEVRLNAAKERYEEAVEKKAQADAVCEDDRMRVDEIDRALDDAYNRLSQLNEEISLAARAAGDLKAEMSALDSTKNAGDSKRAEILESKEKYRENITLLEQRSERAKESAAKYKEKSDEFEKQTVAANAAIADLLTNRKHLEEKQNEIFLAYSSKKNRIDNLSRMEELFEGYSRSVRFIMGEYEKGALPNTTLYGPLSKLITTDPKYATAIETALGANIQNIAVEDEESAKAAIRHLKINNAGRATFYPVTTMRASDFSYSQDIAKKQKGYIGLAHTLISYDKKFDVVIRSLLGRILVCDNIDHAAALARAYDYKVRIVTLDGQQVNAGGSFTGGSVKQDSGMLTRSVEIEKLRGECKQLSEQLDVCKHDAAEIEKAIKQQNDIIENIRVNAAMINTLSQAETTQQQVIEAQLKNDYDMLASLEAEEQKLANSEDLFREEYERLSELIRNTADKEEALRTARADTEAMREELSRSLTEAQRTLSRHQLQAAEIAKDIAVAESNVSAAEQIIRSLKDRAVQANNENSLLAEKKTAYIALIEKNRETIVLREQTIREAEEQSREYREQYRISEQKTNALYEKIREQSHTQELLYKQYTTAENKHKSALDEQDKKVSALWDEYELTYSSAVLLDYPVITAETRSTTATQLASLKAQIKALGHVNVSAIEEYTQVKERYDFLTAQINDLTESRSELAGVIFHLEEEMRSRFSDAMREINHHFQIVFRELFGGGHAELILSEPDNILESGIEINVAPPGKIIKNLMLLSGGEQAFVAIALYFALLKVNPSPFCILDEIEAALDEVNVDKFADYLHRNSAQTQFIVITHRRGTMEVADKLYGVTMADRGISTVLSINANEVGNYVKTSES
ncbi:MAG: chromosome segregation protein SMC [Clostridia bacterium]|nr:chromosome segregation protein SMC [Clostridia bacterium]